MIFVLDLQLTVQTNCPMPDYLSEHVNEQLVWPTQLEPKAVRGWDMCRQCPYKVKTSISPKQKTNQTNILNTTPSPSSITAKESGYNQ